MLNFLGRPTDGFASSLSCSHYVPLKFLIWSNCSGHNFISCVTEFICGIFWHDGSGMDFELMVLMVIRLRALQVGRLITTGPRTSTN